MMHAEPHARPSRLVALDLLSFLLRAMAVAFATALLLVAAVLLLAGRAEAGAPEPGELFLRSPEGRTFACASLASTGVAAQVTGAVARARVSQTFRKTSQSWQLRAGAGGSHDG